MVRRLYRGAARANTARSDFLAALESASRAPVPTHARYAAANKARPAAHPDNGSHHRKPCARGAAGPLSCGVPCSCSAAWRSCTGQSHPGGAQKNSSHATGSAVGLSAVSL